jgi:hypothetical protein
MKLLNSVPSYFITVHQRSRLGIFARSKTSLLRVNTFGLIGVLIAAAVYGCAGNKNDDESDELKVFIDDKTLFSQLPEEWQDAKKVPLSMTRAPDEGAGVDAGQSEWEEIDGDMRLAVRDGNGYLSYVGYSGCSDPYDAYADKSENTYRVLLVMTSYDVFACGDGLYTYHIALGASDKNTKVELYRQQALGGTIVKLASARAENGTADCVGLTRCDADNPCENENVVSPDDDPINMPPGRMNCTVLDACEGAVCAYTREACVIQCGLVECAMLKSYPLQLACNE